MIRKGNKDYYRLKNVGSISQDKIWVSPQLHYYFSVPNIQSASQVSPHHSYSQWKTTPYTWYRKSQFSPLSSQVLRSRVGIACTHKDKMLLKSTFFLQIDEEYFLRCIRWKHHFLFLRLDCQGLCNICKYLRVIRK